MGSKKYFLYHAVPDQLTGNVIYPLNQLKKKYPTIYREQAKKYAGDPFLMQYRLPILNCGWNDVIHLSAVPPHQLYHHLLEAGFSPLPWSCFAIDPLQLDLKNLLVYWYRQDYLLNAGKNEFERFQTNQLRRLAHFPKETQQYYEDCFERKVNPLFYHRTPHLFYKGTIPIADCPLVSALNE